MKEEEERRRKLEIGKDKAKNEIILKVVVSDACSTSY